MTKMSVTINLTPLPEKQWQVIPTEELEKELGVPKFYDVMMAAKAALNAAIPNAAGSIDLSNYLIRPVYAQDFLWPSTIAGGSLDPVAGTSIASSAAGTPVFKSFIEEQGYGAGSNTNTVKFQFQLPKDTYMIFYALRNLAGTPLTTRLDVGVNQSQPMYSFILDNLNNYADRTGVLVIKDPERDPHSNVFPFFSNTDVVTLTYYNYAGNGSTVTGTDMLQILGFLAKPAGSALLPP